VTLSENRKLTELVAVRFTESDLDLLRREAARLGVSVQQYLRDTSLRTVQAAAS
jgi:predicted DNA binding CopG/RHH family protein